VSLVETLDDDDEASCSRFSSWYWSWWYRL
jgi:hypothetical protein